MFVTHQYPIWTRWYIRIYTGYPDATRPSHFVSMSVSTSTPRDYPLFLRAIFVMPSQKHFCLKLLDPCCVFTRASTMVPGVSDMPVLATILHLVLSEWLPIWMFYFAYYTLMTETSSYLYLWYMDVELTSLSDLVATLDPDIQTLGEYFFCIQNEMNVASWSFDLSYVGTCVSLRGGYNLLAVANYSCLLLCCGLVLSSICLILWNDGSDICTGKYLATKWRFEKTRLSYCLAVLLVLMVIACFLVTAIVSGATLKTKTYLGAPLENDWFGFAHLANRYDTL